MYLYFENSRYHLFIWLYMILIFNALKDMHKNSSHAKKSLDLLVENLILKLFVENFD